MARNYQCLKAEDVKPQYVGLDDQTRCDMMNAPGSGIATQGVAKTDDLKRWMVKQVPASLIASFRDYAVNGNDPDAKKAAAGLVEILDELVMNINMHNEKAQWSLNALVAVGEITQAQMDEATALGDTPTTIANGCGFNKVKVGHLLHARTV